MEEFEKQEKARILDVGCGYQGIGPYICAPFVGCDPLLAPDPNRPRRPHRNMRPVVGSACELPFADDTFDTVVSMDMLEHIQPPDRESALKELYRVAARKVIVGFPHGPHWARWEDRTRKWYRFRKRQVPEWLEEHIEYGLPTEDSVRSFFEREKIPYTQRANANNAFHFLINLIEGSFLEPTVSEASRIIGYGLWSEETHRWKANFIRHQRDRVFFLLKWLNFGKTVRQIYILRKI